VTHPTQASRWRVGRSLGRTLYRDAVWVGELHGLTAEEAADVVVALNAREAARSIGRAIAEEVQAEMLADAPVSALLAMRSPPGAPVTCSHCGLTLALCLCGRER